MFCEIKDANAKKFLKTFRNKITFVKKRKEEKELEPQLLPLNEVYKLME